MQCTEYSSISLQARTSVSGTVYTFQPRRTSAVTGNELVGSGGRLCPCDASRPGKELLDMSRAATAMLATATQDLLCGCTQSRADSRREHPTALMWVAGEMYHLGSEHTDKASNK